MTLFSELTEVEMWGPRETGEIARALDNAGVLNVLWGTYLLSMYTVPAITFGPEYIVPDHLLETARETLVKEGFPLCTDPYCRREWKKRVVYFPEIHFHVRGALEVRLHKKSDLLHGMPDPELKIPDEKDPNYMLASDSRLKAPTYHDGSMTNSGRFDNPDWYPVKIPTVGKYYEILLNLEARDSTYLGKIKDWLGWICWLWEYNVLEPLQEGDLSPQHWKVFDATRRNERSGSKAGTLAIRAAKEELAKYLLENKIIPEPKEDPTWVPW